MDGVESGLKQRVNGNMLPQLQGQSVCLLGIAKNVDTNGVSFTLTTTDNVDVQINMREPLNEYVAGLTEVHGEVGPQNNVMCSNYVVFPEEAASNFDLELYNTAVETVARFPNHYITSAT